MSYENKRPRLGRGLFAPPDIDAQSVAIPHEPSMWLPAGLGVLIGILALFAAAGCSESAPPTEIPPTATPIDPEALLHESGAVMEALQSFHFLLTHDKGSTRLIEGLEIFEAEGDVVNPDRLYAAFTGELGAFVIKSAIIAVDDANYMQNFLTGEWLPVAPDVNPLAFFDPQKGISAMMSLVERVSLADPEPNGGTLVVVVEGALPATALAPLLGSALEDATVRVRLTIDIDRSYLIEARVEGRVVASDAEDVVRVIKLSRFNEDIDIQPPL